MVNNLDVVRIGPWQVKYIKRRKEKNTEMCACAIIYSQAVDDTG